MCILASQYIQICTCAILLYKLWLYIKGIFLPIRLCFQGISRKSREHPDQLSHCVVREWYSLRLQEPTVDCENSWKGHWVTYNHCCICKATSTEDDRSHSSPGLFTLLPSGINVQAHPFFTSRHHNSFFSEAVRLPNTMMPPSAHLTQYD